MPPALLPLIADYQPERVFAWHEGRAMRCDHALAGMQTLAMQLTADTPYINLCEQRYSFTLAFAAIGLAGGVNLLPQNHARETVNSLRADFPDALTIDDAQVKRWLAATNVTESARECPALDAATRLAIVFTSGSTGRPGRHEKLWGDLVMGADLYRRRFFADVRHPQTVATVPPQHMYGLETTVLPMLQLGHAVDTGRPFLPWDIAAALERLAAPRVLVATPMHLRVCLDAGVTMPPLECVISATAPLDADLAGAIEAAWQTRVLEIYGSTETGSVASRRTTAGDIWQLYDGMQINRGEGVMISGTQLPQSRRLQDDFDILDARHFRLLGRSGDMLKIAGKRMSINDITRQLQAIEGVRDAVVFRLDEDSQARPAALVVAPGVEERAIAARLAQAMDDIFVPRPLLRVDQLPRNALGKLPRQAVLSLLQQARRGGQGGRNAE